MSNFPALSNRLKLCADLVREGVSVADIGTDHALLPCFLVKTGKCFSAVASDINKGPLKKAEKTLMDYDVLDKIRLNLGAGLEGISPLECDDIVIAGMGGDNIATILSESEWSRDPAKRFILQPMTSIPELRKFLCQNGYEIISEYVAVEEPKYYVVIHAMYNAHCFEPSKLFCEIGKLSEKFDDNNVRDYFKFMINKFNRIIYGAQRSRIEVDTERYKKLVSDITNLLLK